MSAATGGGSTSCAEVAGSGTAVFVASAGPLAALASAYARLMSPDTRTALVTGANSGMGRATALELARRGWRVVAACRTHEKATRTAEEFRADTGNAEIHPGQIDLGDLASVRDCAESVLAGGGPLHVLVNNAGVGGQRGVTADGFELAFGTNYLGHFLLTITLLPLLQQSVPARVVTVASDEHHRATTIDFDAVRRPTKTFLGLREYAVSKLANVLFSQELARRAEGTGITTYAVHPGAVATNIYRRAPLPLRALITRRMRSPAQGAETAFWCATSPVVADQTGLHYVDCHPALPSRHVTPELARELWQRSEEWTRAWRRPRQLGTRPTAKRAWSLQARPLPQPDAAPDWQPMPPAVHVGGIRSAPPDAGEGSSGARRLRTRRRGPRIPRRNRR